MQNSTTGFTDVGLEGVSGSAVDITGEISGGSLGALITTRDTTIPGYISDLDSLAKSITQNVNYFHGQGNDGAGIAFFQPETANYAKDMGLSDQIQDSSGNIRTENVMASSSTANPTDNDVALRIASLANETLLGGDSVTSKVLSSNGAQDLSGNLVVNGVAVALAPTDTLATIASAITSQTNVSAKVVQVQGGYQLVLTPATGEQNISVLNGTLDTSSTAASLLQTLTTTALPQTTTGVGVTGSFSLDGQTIQVTSGQTLAQIAAAINGNANITDVSAQVAGSASAGYKLEIDTVPGGSALNVSGAITQTLGLSGSTYSDYEAGVVSKVGEAVKSATNLVTYNQNALTSLKGQQASESGVSIDEEMSNLIQYENAYQAAARLYTVADGLLKTLLQSVGVSTA